MARLGVNIDHIATLRQARGGAEPDPVAGAVLVELAGADGIVVHLREDRRHIQDRDLHLLKQVIKTRLDLEMAAVQDMVKTALQVRPYMVTLVPEKRMELTTEGGLDAVNRRAELQEVVAALQDAGIIVSLFIDPDPDQIKVSHKLRADCIEIHTGAYANAADPEAAGTALEVVHTAARFAAKLGLGVNAGHGLDYRNIIPLAKIAEIQEFNIGHSIITRAVYVGLERAVREMKQLVA